MESKPIYKIKNWGLEKLYLNSSSIRYAAPELQFLYKLVGNVESHPKFTDNEVIYTSIIKTIEDRIVKTASGSIYELVGEPILIFKESYIKTYGSYDKNKPLFHLSNILK